MGGLGGPCIHLDPEEPAPGIAETVLLADPHPERAVLSHLGGRFLVTGVCLNGVEHPFDTSTVFTPNAWARLQRLRATYDPRGVLHTPHAAPAPVGT